MALKKAQKQTVYQTFSILAFLVSIILVIFGFIALWAHNFVGGMVRDQLSAQKIYFPEAGDSNFSPTEYPTLQKYAGQIVDSPEKAEAYANDYIGHHLKQIGGGQVYSEISAASKANPDDASLKAKAQTMFQGETLRGVLLTSGYGFGTIGQIAGIVTWACFIGAGLGFVSSVIFRKKATN